jgi:membrane-bound lytic murein transglycosylase D
MRAARHARPWPLVAALLFLPFTGCSAGRTSVAAGRWIEHPTIGRRQAVEPSRVEPSIPSDAQRARQDDSPFETSHPQVLSFLDKYQTSLRAFLSKALSRGSRYIPEMASILEQEGVPAELAYLPIVESGFRLDAVSRAGAVGPWQFVRATGRRYGLRIDGYVDERRDPEKATRAAARYLKDLYDMFGDWHLSLAAYNTGEGNIARIRDDQKIADYWEMCESGRLPNETSEFVPRFLAAMEIAKAPEDYGFEVDAAEPMSYDEVHVSRSISLRTVARLSGTTLTAVRQLNPALRRGVVPPKGYTLKVPQGTGRRFEVAYARLPQTRPLPRGRTHRVRRGETPSSIARRYNLTTGALMRANGIRNPRRLRAGSVLRIPDRRSAPDPNPILASKSKRPGSRDLN